jgi:hypothetical protein
MRRTVDYRSALVRAAALGGSAFVQVVPARALARRLRTGIEQLVHGRDVNETYQRQRSWASIEESSEVGLA